MSELFGEFKMFRDKTDPWGESMRLWFTICDTLNARGDDVPYTWEYHAGIGGLDTEASYFDDIKDIDSADLVHYGNVLCRHTRLMDHLGLSY